MFVKSNGKDISIKDFSEWFYGEWAIRESCYRCPFTRIDRDTDITIGDYWGIETAMPRFADPMGVSLALVHSEEGQELFNSIKENIEFQENDKNNCLQPRLVSPANKPEDRAQFWTDIKNKGIEYCLVNYKQKEVVIPLWRKIGSKIKYHLKKFIS